MAADHGKTTPSHLENESRGGETAQGGFVFQDGVLIASLPQWLAHEGFDCLIRESIGDAEARFFCPDSGYEVDFVEAKNHRVTPAEFWNEIGRFQAVAAGSGRTYRRFTLACTGASEDVEAIGRALRRVRDPAVFYGVSPVVQNSLGDFVQVVKHHGHSEGMARFLYDFVDLRWDFGPGQNHAEALFRQAVADFLPQYRDVPSRFLGCMFAALLKLIGPRINKPILRSEIEHALHEAVDHSFRAAHPPVSVHTAVGDDRGRSTDLRFEWDDFFGGGDRTYPAPDEWDRRVVGKLREMQGWIIRQRSSRRIVVRGSRRISATLALGSVFSAVSGFSVELHHRGEVWATDAHDGADTPSYHFDVRMQGDAGEQFVVGVGILRDVVPDIEACLASHGLGGAPRLYLHGAAPVVSPQHANRVAAQIKAAISERSALTGTRKVHLFFAGPSHVALFLGHRLNAAGVVQCYELVRPGLYVPTCRLNT